MRAAAVSLIVAVDGTGRRGPEETAMDRNESRQHGGAAGDDPARGRGSGDRLEHVPVDVVAG
jgi:hypothetical protein